MWSAFAVEHTIPAEVRRDECVLFAHSAPDMVAHLPRHGCAVEAPHEISTCGLLEPLLDVTLDALAESFREVLKRCGPA